VIVILDVSLLSLPANLRCFTFSLRIRRKSAEPLALSIGRVQVRVSSCHRTMSNLANFLFAHAISALSKAQPGEPSVLRQLYHTLGAHIGDLYRAILRINFAIELIHCYSSILPFPSLNVLNNSGLNLSRCSITAFTHFDTIFPCPQACSMPFTMHRSQVSPRKDKVVATVVSNLNLFTNPLLHCVYLKAVHC
jgi:hypothetical protein